MKNCVPQVSFISTQDYPFGLIHLPRSTDQRDSPSWSHQKIGKDESFLVIEAPDITGMRRLVEDGGNTYELLPVGTELTLTGTVARIIPMGMNRIFNPSHVSLKGKVGGYTVWISYSSIIHHLGRKDSTPETKEKLIALGMLEPNSYKFINDRKWSCPKKFWSRLKN